MAGSRAAYVLDSFALLAYLEGEPGMVRVRSVLEGAAAQRHTVYLSLINLGEAGSFKVETRVVGLDGRVLSGQTNQIEAAANARTPVGKPDLAKLADGHAVLVALKVTDPNGIPVSDNFYWWAKDESSYRELNSLPVAQLVVAASPSPSGDLTISGASRTRTASSWRPSNFSPASR